MKPYYPSPTIALPGRAVEAPERRHLLAELGALLTRDVGLTVVVCLAAGLSVASIVYFGHAGLLTAYGDARARLLIARTVIEGRHPALAHLGGIWPPFPQVYMLPLVWSDVLFYSGLAGAIPSAASYVVASAFLYKLVVRVTREQMSGLVAVAAFSGPNVLYLQSAPMSELPFLACFIGAVYYTTSWMLDGSLRALFLAGLTASLATLTRYEGWPLVILLSAVVVFACWRGGHAYHETEGHLIFFGLMAFSGIGLWLVWNRVVLGDVLYFLHSQYGTQTINNVQLLALPPAARPTGNLTLSALVLGWTVVDNLGWLVTAISVVGLVRLVTSRPSAAALVAGLVLLFPVAFSLAAIYAGAEVVVDPHATPGLLPTNTRYGLLLAPAAGYLVGWLARGRWLAWPVLVGCAVSALLVWHGGLVDVQDATQNGTMSRESDQLAALWLEANYDGGVILAQRRTSSTLLFTARVPLADVVYDGDRPDWGVDTVDPGPEVHWVIMDVGNPSVGAPPDTVWQRLHDNPRFTDRYNLAFQSGQIQIFRETGS